ncbi:MAG: RnfH family protein [Wenzhouxiangella sp.]
MAEAAAETLSVEVVAALPERQWLVALQVPVGTTVWEAVQRSGLAEQVPDYPIDRQRLGLFGRLCRADQPLSDGDRVELYRPLKADPKEVRRQLAELERASAQGSRRSVSRS